MLTFLMLLAALAGFFCSVKAQGRAAAETETLKGTLDDIEKADAARAAVDADPAVAKRVRDEFTR